MSTGSDAVIRHYGGDDLRQRIEHALAEVGVSLDSITTRDLAPVDEFHSRGRRATRELAQLAAPTAADRVVDVGAGLGGPARYLAERFGCTVTAIDLTASFCEVARWLNALTGLQDQVQIHQGSGTALPFDDQSFDIAWTIQMQMNIDDKARLYQEIHRVLRPGGRFVMQELCAGDAGDCHFPTPWADGAGISHLLSPQALTSAVEAAGFVPTQWQDTTDDALAWYAQHNASTDAAPSPLGTHLVMGRDAAHKRGNVERNYREGRLRQVLGAFHKP